MTQATLNHGEIPNISVSFEDTVNCSTENNTNPGEKDDCEDSPKDSTGEDSGEKCLSCQSGNFEPKIDLAFNTLFCCEFAVRKSMTEVCDKFYHPFQIKATQRDNPEKNVRAKIVYKCTHGVDRSKQPKRPQATL